jgi:peptidylprolyl isomerase/peptidyl-prolyl cis-trans isomerase B (cyclophilin B)
MPRFFQRLLPALFSVFLLGTAGCNADEPRKQPVDTAPAKGEPANPRVVIETNKGKIVVELFPKQAPKSVENFLAYVNSGFYKETVFHRVIPGFMAQGGGFDLGLNKKDTQPPITNEADNQLRNLRGTLAMARTNDPHSATAQFFINVADNASLDHRGKTGFGWGYAVFGQVVEGMNVVDTIVAVPRGTVNGMQDVPQQPVVMTQVSVAP